jgi:hypothetical protein
VWRRVERSSGGWLALAFHADTEAEAEAAYDAYCQESAERSAAQAARRSRWGP